MPSFVAKLMYMEKRHGEERKATGTGSISEPEVTYARQSRRSRTRSGVSRPDSKEETEVAWKRQMDDFVAESLRIHESGDAAARKDFSRRMEAFMRENSTRERLMERIAVSERQLQSGVVLPAVEADAAVRRALPWLR